MTYYDVKHLVILGIITMHRRTQHSFKLVVCLAPRLAYKLYEHIIMCFHSVNTLNELEEKNDLQLKKNYVSLLKSEMPTCVIPNASRCIDESEIMRQLKFDADFWPQLKSYLSEPANAALGANFLQDFTHTLSDLATDLTYRLQKDYRKYPFVRDTDFEWRTALINRSCTLVWKLTGAPREASMRQIAGCSIVVQGVQIGNVFIGANY